MAIGALALAGCSAGQAVPATTLSGPTSTATSVPPTTTASTSARLPPLGQLAPIFFNGKGFGQVKPPEFYNGDDRTGLVQHVVWKSWGGPKAVATGEAEYVAPNQDVAQGTEEPATVVAFKLGDCVGNFMYSAIEWYFPQHGQRFNPNQYEDLCNGAYVTSRRTPRGPGRSPWSTTRAGTTTAAPRSPSATSGTTEARLRT